MLGPSLPAAATRGGPAPVARTLGDWLRRETPPVGRKDFPKPAGGGNLPETPLFVKAQLAICPRLRRNRAAGVLQEASQILLLRCKTIPRHITYSIKVNLVCYRSNIIVGLSI